MNAKDWNPYIGKKYGRSTIVKHIEKASRVSFIAKCDCGKERSVTLQDLEEGNANQCKKCAHASRIVVKIGDKYGRLTVIDKSEPYYYKGNINQLRYKCKCECGNEYIAFSHMLRQSKSIQCHECAMSKLGTHRLSGSPTHNSWTAMMDRCYMKSASSYPSYGGRGIKVCDRWHKFERFLEDMGLKPTGHRMALDRIDNDGDYELSNCRWVTMQENNMNRRSSKQNKDKYITVRKSKLCNLCILLK